MNAGRGAGGEELNDFWTGRFRAYLEEELLEVGLGCIAALRGLGPHGLRSGAVCVGVRALQNFDEVASADENDSS